jgi:hypothetical protein
MTPFLLQRGMSAFGTKQTSELNQPMSAFGGKADIAELDSHFLSAGWTRYDALVSYPG